MVALTMLVRVIVICVFLTVALKSDNAFTRPKKLVVEHR